VVEVRDGTVTQDGYHRIEKARKLKIEQLA
jgi:hypothetical protein